MTSLAVLVERRPAPRVEARRILEDRQCSFDGFGPGSAGFKQRRTRL